MVDKRSAQVEDDFQALSSQRRLGFMTELGRFAMQTKKWWLVPLIVVLLGIGLVIILGGTAAAPFIYTLF
jgi:hypothetical protein